MFKKKSRVSIAIFKIIICLGDFAKINAIQSYYICNNIDNQPPLCNNSLMSEQNTEPAEEDKEEKLWTNELTIYFIDCIKSHNTSFESHVKKHIWTKIAKLCSEFSKKSISATQCDNKWRSLKRTYKSINLHNKTSGQSRKRWEYFDIINDFMHNKPEINPIATCSSNAGLLQGEAPSTSTSILSEIPTSASGTEVATNKENVFESSFSRKRKQKASQLDQRHKDKMARLDRFNDLFETFINKMPESGNN